MKLLLASFFPRDVGLAARARVVAHNVADANVLSAQQGQVDDANFLVERHLVNATGVPDRRTVGTHASTQHNAQVVRQSRASADSNVTHTLLAGGCFFAA